MSETPRPSSKNRRNPERRLTPRAGTGGAIWYVLGFMLLLAIAQAFFYQMQGGETISYSDFKNLVRQDKVQEITLSDERVRGLQRRYVEVWADRLRELHDGLGPDRARAMAHAAFGLLNSTPHSAVLPEDEMREILEQMAAGALGLR